MSINDGKEIVDDKMLDTKEGKKDCKCPEYVLRARRNYYNKNKDKAQFIEKNINSCRKYREENYEMLLERDRIRMRNKRAAAKNAKLAAQVEVNTSIVNEPEVSTVASVASITSVDSEIVNKIAELVVV